MLATNTAVGTAAGERMLFATTRPSRADQVTCSDDQIEARRVKELAWGAEIGMNVDAIKAGGLITGSPTGSKKIHTFDDFVDDIGPL